VIPHIPSIRIIIMDSPIPVRLYPPRMIVTIPRIVESPIVPKLMGVKPYIKSVVRSPYTIESWIVEIPRIGSCHRILSEVPSEREVCSEFSLEMK
jgi:hypothetical protein